MFIKTAILQRTIPDRRHAVITIKKYPNRRLYDTSQRRYINLDDIRNMVIERLDFEIVDSKTGANLTKSVLLLVISEFEANEQQSLLTDTLLRQLIRFYGSDMRDFIRKYLELSVSGFMEQQDTLRGMMKNLIDVTPLGLLGKLKDKIVGSDKEPKTEGKSSKE
jgi:polyhydroxyalkanoate synthesis repressor PhaR